MSWRLGVFLLVILLLPSPAAAQPTLDGCDLFPVDNAWNTDISTAKVHPNSANYIANINANGDDFVHPDFGSDPTYGIPWTTVPGSQPKVPITFDYADESDPGPYPIPSNVPIEAGEDHHIIVLDRDNCLLYETWDSRKVSNSPDVWEAGSGAIFNLDSNELRPDGWTSADAAGLPILPGLARCDEANSGVINHALRFTVNETQQAHIYPATHHTFGNIGTNYPPMGLRLRLKVGYNLSDFTGQALAVATALKRYGMILADNGSNWFISGENNPACWNDHDLDQLKDIPGTAFEVIISPPPPATPIRNVYFTPLPTLRWGPVTWATRYNIEISGGTLPNPILDYTSDPSYRPATALGHGIYTWRVRAQDVFNRWSAWSASEMFVVHG